MHGSRIIREIKASGIEFIPCLPDIHTSEGLLRPLTTDTELKLVRVCKEDEGVGICAALSYCNKRALLLMQYSGMLDSVNAIRIVAAEYGLPVCMMVGLLNKEPGVAPKESKHYSVRVTAPILEALGVDYHVIESDADVAKIKPAIDNAYAKSRPVVLFIGRSPVP
ncbi:MAG: decarboxylase [Bradyrhizobium sp.]|nr:decarboxylase [Bradyrhizobium sp.]